MTAAGAGDGSGRKRLAAGRKAPTARTAGTAVDPAAFVLLEAPGHLLRRAQQQAVEIYTREVGETGPTPPQFALLLALRQNPGVNQSDLVRLTGIDRSTLAELLGRLIERGLIARRRAARDRRVNELHLSGAGEKMLAAALPGVRRAQAEMLAPLPAGLRRDFLRALRLLVGDSGG